MVFRGLWFVFSLPPHARPVCALPNALSSSSRRHFSRNRLTGFRRVAITPPLSHTLSTRGLTDRVGARRSLPGQRRGTRPGTVGGHGQTASGDAGRGPFSGLRAGEGGQGVPRKEVGLEAA